MRVLLDTHAFLWADTDPSRLGDQRAVVEHGSTELLVSAATSWEIAIKFGLGRLELPATAAQYVTDAIRELGATPVAVEHAHALAVATLPAHHRDPFDRLLIAQARLLDTPVVTADRAFAAYDVEVLAISAV